MKNLRFYLVTVCSLLLFPLGAAAAEWQWSVSIPSMTSEETEGHPQAFLWIPADCQQVKAVVVGQHNMCEETLFDNPSFRKRMQEAGIAVVWITPILDFPWKVENGCNQALLTALDDLAKVSGYTELKYAPIVPLGHSAMATYPWNFAAWNAERTLAVISYHGDAPRTNLCGYGRENLEWGRNRNIDGIPGLMIEGEYEWWEARVNPALAFRMMYPASCISFLCDAGRGHFDVADRTADYVGLFLKKAVEQRVPANWDGHSLPALKKLKPEEGWLAERWLGGNGQATETRQASTSRMPKRVSPAPFHQYKGDKHDAFWYFDKEMAELTESIYRQEADKKPQYVGFIQEGKLLAYNPQSHVRVNARFIPESDGLTFHLKGTYTNDDHTAIQNKNHAQTPVHISRICGPVRQIDDTTFQVAFYRMGTNNARRTPEINLLAYSDGDKVYKSTVQELSFRIPYPLTEGKRQCLLFPGLPDVKAGTATLSPKATSDCGLPVSYYIKEGPAEMVDGKIVFTPIPPRSKFPVKVTVVAWQYGLQGKVQTADPVERSFYIYK